MLKGISSSIVQEDFRIRFMKKKQAKTSQKSGKNQEKTLRNNFSCISLTNLSESKTNQLDCGKKMTQWSWSTPQLNKRDKLAERRKSSEWSKLRNSLEFISRSREALCVSSSKVLEDTQYTDCPHSSLTFLGQLYDVPIENEKHGFRDIFK